MTSTRDWTIRGSAGEVIRGTTHAAAADAPARGAAIVLHGFKGWKDYGLIPRIAEAFAMAGCTTHRFTFSHAGIDDDARGTFGRPDLFRRDTWNRQVEDVHHVLAAMDAGTIDGGGSPVRLVGHSRGGVTAILAAGRAADGTPQPRVAGIATFAAPDRCLSLGAEEEAALLHRGSLPTVSARTGDVLEIGADFVREVRAEPAAHDVPALLAATRCPVLIVHGDHDHTVPLDSARALARAAGRRATLHIVPGGDHTFGVRHPHPARAPLPAALDDALGALRRWIATADTTAGTTAGTDTP
ncbi:MAG: alpha/beta hydrolase [Phycisphaeraceae bacterium]|nr:alpha/beta hydrolase [Phycisphaeraceae bacterium]